MPVISPAGQISTDTSPHRRLLRHGIAPRSASRCSSSTAFSTRSAAPPRAWSSVWTSATSRCSAQARRASADRPGRSRRRVPGATSGACQATKQSTTDASAYGAASLFQHHRGAWRMPSLAHRLTGLRRAITTPVDLYCDRGRGRTLKERTFASISRHSHDGPFRGDRKPGLLVDDRLPRKSQHCISGLPICSRSDDRCGSTRCFGRRSIAVIGASEKPTIGRRLIVSLDRIGFTGQVFPINPSYPTVLGRTCYPTSPTPRRHPTSRCSASATGSSSTPSSRRPNAASGAR